jgi:hypothetical protein
MLRCPTCGRDYPSEVQFCPEDQTALQADATIIGEGVTDPLIGHTLDGKYQIEGAPRNRWDGHLSTELGTC